MSHIKLWETIYHHNAILCCFRMQSFAAIILVLIAMRACSDAWFLTPSREYGCIVLFIDMDSIRPGAQ